MRNLLPRITFHFLSYSNNRKATIVFVSSRRIESYTYTLNTKGQLQNLTLGQGHERPLGDLCSPCCIAFDASRWKKTLWRLSHVSSSIKAKVISKNVDWPHDVSMWPQMTFQGLHIQICIGVINSSLNEHGSERFEQIWEVFEELEFFPIYL